MRKWVGRFAREGPAGLADRSSRPHGLHCPTAPAAAAQALELRRQRMLMKHIAAQLALSIATASRLLKRGGLSRLSALSAPPPIQRYEYPAAGDLLHLDTKKLDRFHRVGSRITGTHQKRSLGAGFEVAHVCIDDHSRLAYAEVLPNERKETTTRCSPAPSITSRRGISGRPHHDRQWLRLSLLPYCRPVPQPQDAAHLYPPLHPAHQRQGRTLHPDRYAPMGLRQTLQSFPAARRRAPPLACIPTTITALISASAAAPRSPAFRGTTCSNSTPSRLRKNSEFSSRLDIVA